MHAPNYLILILLFGFIIEGFTFTYVLAQGSKSVVNVAYLFMSAFATIWIFSDLLQNVLQFPDLYVVPAYKMACFTWQSMGLLFTIFTYNLLKKKIDFIIYIIAIIAIISIIVTLTTDLVIGELDISPLKRSFIRGSLYVPVLLFSEFFPFVYCCILLLKRMRIETDKILKKQINFVVTGTILTFVVINYFYVISPFILNFKDTFKPGGAPLVIHSIFIFIAITKYKFFKIGIQEAASDLFSNVKEGIVIMDNEGKIIQNNKAFETKLDIDFKIKPIQFDTIIDLAVYIKWDDYSFDKDYENHEISYIANSKLVISLISQTTIFESNIPIGKMLNIRDITKRKKAQEELEKQKEIIEHKNKEITDSIKYAQYIQKAILPPEEVFKNLFKQHFILFKPKDIVSGDFYWVYHTNDKIIWIVADCTGHGVPGAFMSMIGNSLLNEIIIDNGITEADTILNELRKSIIKTLGQTGKEGEARDGMDIALCVISSPPKSPQRRDLGGLGAVLEFSGANNPLYIVRKGIANSKIAKTGNIEYYGEDLAVFKPNKQSIGYEQGKSGNFTKHQIQLQKGDVIYIFSDGYADQFGGDHCKKFNYNRFKQLLTNISDKNMEEQKVILDSTIEAWKDHIDPYDNKPLEQMDDILVIGVRI